MPLPAASLIEYPCDFPVKVLGEMQPAFVQTVIELVQKFDTDFNAETIEMRPSANQKYMGLTVIIRATSREQLDDLYRALSSHPMVKVVL